MEVPRDRPAGARDALILFAILFLALALRLHGLGRESLWYDEAFTFRFARQSFAEMNRLLVAEVWDPPVYPWLVWAWVRLVGAGDWQVRLLSALFGTLGVLVLHGLARALFDLRTAHVAAFLAAVSQFLVAYSQEARCYAVLLFFLVATLRAFVGALREPEKLWRWLAFGLLAGVSTLTHYYTLFALLALALFALAAPAGLLSRNAATRPFRGLLAAALVFALALLPWLASGVVAGATRQRVAQFEHVAPWFAVDVLTFVRTMTDFHGGRMAGMLARAPRWTHAVGALLYGLPALLALSALRPGCARRSERAQVVLLVLLWLVPMACLIALGFARVQFATRYVLFCLPPYLVLAARGIAVSRLPLRPVLLLAIGTWSALGLRALYTIPHKEDYRGALSTLALHYRPGDKVLFLPFGVLPLEWPVYHPEGPELDVLPLDSAEQAQCDRLWVLEYQRVRDENEGTRRARAAVNQRWKKVRETPFFLVKVELWERPDAANPPDAQGRR